MGQKDEQNKAMPQLRVGQDPPEQESLQDVFAVLAGMLELPLVRAAREHN